MEYNKEVLHYRQKNLSVNSGNHKSVKINCFKCKHFRVTWNPEFPRACKIFGFKGKNMPSQTVLLTTGKPCPAFEPKNV